MFNQDGDLNEKKTAGFVFRWWMFGILLVVVASVIMYALSAAGLIFQKRIERTVNRESQQMVQSVTEQLRADLEKWTGINNQIVGYQNAMTDPKNADVKATIQSTIDGLVSQQKQLIKKMHTDADSLTPSGYNELPTDIQAFLQANP